MQTTTRATAMTEAKTSVRWKIFLMMLFLIAINYIDRASLSVAMPLIAKEFDLSPAMQGLILSSFFWTYALMQVPGGMLADKYKPRIVIACATVFWGIAQAVAAFTTNATSLLLTRLGLGAAEAPIYPAGGKLNAIWMTQNERGRGATLLDGGAPLGAALGAIIITWLIASLGSWRLAFIVAGVGTVLAGVLAWYYVRNSPREHRGVNELEARYIEEALASEHRAEPANLSGRSLDFFKYRSVWCMAIGWMCFNTVFYGLLTWMPNYLNKVHGFDIKQMGGASFIIFFSGFVGELIGGWIADKWKEAGGRPNVVMRTLFGIAAVVATASIFSVAYVTDPVVVVVLLSSTLFFLRWCGLFWCVPSMLGTRNKVGFLGGVMNLGGNIGGISVPIIVGMIVQFTGSYFLALMFFAAAGVGLLLASTAIDYETKIPV
ncbi:MFS transporter [Cupriavidus taiwanensis]|uniref:Putative transporter, MFS family putative Sugar phosphate permease n=1 Tax=Cupriavidus taiwanensis TaxID=164546 RepID=A0A375IWP5_9BURK|nr:MFS transporter [Cupriavidus taiwanensis]SOZ14711.1 putative transporter, MFS family; putative Sugar phosphate permease [Cupriavidus taiwanensis]SOZ26420.1 putative transporter, MFS family; putative Sugar phosphate permease [Cupriavidus taiwanensis]SOZ45284.1 putative transporter, MFS family; putative Sugar phosphate permease [Cupriavidus taiwanensis]SPR95970.1 putative transporter, MFS family; putative Sugar phosphate permease [Cupriavidus taiwanensis]